MVEPNRWTPKTDSLNLWDSNESSLRTAALDIGYYWPRTYSVLGHLHYLDQLEFINNNTSLTWEWKLLGDTKLPCCRRLFPGPVLLWRHPPVFDALRCWDYWTTGERRRTWGSHALSGFPSRCPPAAASQDLTWADASGYRFVARSHNSWLYFWNTLEGGIHWPQELVYLLSLSRWSVKTPRYPVSRILLYHRIGLMIKSWIRHCFIGLGKVRTWILSAAHIPTLLCYTRDP